MHRSRPGDNGSLCERPQGFFAIAGNVYLAQEALAKRFDFTNDTVFDLEDFAIAENVQAGLRYGANEFHTLGLEEGLMAVFQRNIDDRLN